MCRSRADIERSYLRHWQEVTARGEQGQVSTQTPSLSVLRLMQLCIQHSFPQDDLLTPHMHPSTSSSMTALIGMPAKHPSSLGSMPHRSRMGKGLGFPIPMSSPPLSQARMTVFSALAFLPVWAKFTLVPDFLRFAWWLVWVRVLAVAHVFHRAAVMQGGISFGVL